MPDHDELPDGRRYSKPTHNQLNYIKKTKDVPKEQLGAFVEASSLEWLLHKLKECGDERSPHDPWLQVMTRLATLGGSLDQYKHTLEVLVPQIVLSYSLR
jgi:hypothetical protein